MNLSESILDDVAKITKFAQEVVEADRRSRENGAVRPGKDDETVRTSLEGDRRNRLFALLSAFIDHLERVRKPEELPGRCPETVALMSYSLWALSAYIERTKDPIGLATVVFGGAVEFFDEFIARSDYFLRMISGRTWPRIMRVALKSAIRIGSFQLTHKWFNDALGELRGGKAETGRQTSVGNKKWTLREIEVVKELARREGMSPGACADAAWAENELEFSAATHFIEPYRGYGNPTSLKSTAYRINTDAE